MSHLISFHYAAKTMGEQQSYQIEKKSQESTQLLSPSEKLERLLEQSKTDSINSINKRTDSIRIQVY